MTDWDPAQYERFKAQRSQPFWDLIDLVQPVRIERAVDLGCGTGELTDELHRPFVDAYRDELLAMQADGVLTRLDLAWSRDQAHKIYVQNRIAEQGEELWKWIEGGAIFYVCGDASYMAKDVDAALVALVAEGAGLSEEDATAYVAQMKKDKRYQPHVY